LKEKLEKKCFYFKALKDGNDVNWIQLVNGLESGSLLKRTLSENALRSRSVESWPRILLYSTKLLQYVND
jgi:hypothetical protein